MRSPRRPRVLSREESRLWEAVARLVTPLRARAEPAPVTEPEPVRQPERPSPAPPGKRARVAPAPPTAAPYRASVPVPAPPSGLERRARLALKRGRLGIDARLDLHGMVQAEAHAALIGFLTRARAAGHAHVLVVTGKGGPTGGPTGGPEGAFSERGVLRRSVPHWLRGPALRGLVLGFEEAAAHHGGAGALYVRLRRR